MVEIWLKVELMPGALIGEVAKQLCATATRLGVGLTANFNGVRLFAGPDDDFGTVIERYRRWGHK